MAIITLHILLPHPRPLRLPLLQLAAVGCTDDVIEDKDTLQWVDVT